MNSDQEPKQGLVLVADDDAAFAAAFAQALRLQGYEAIEVTKAEDVSKFAAKRDFDLITLDLNWGRSDIDGIGILKKLLETDPFVPIVMLTSAGSIATAVEATKLGAFNYIEKSLDRSRTLMTVANAIDLGRSRRENAALLSELRSKYEIKGESEPIRSVLTSVRKAGPTETLVLITGETGTGKLLVAGQLHYFSKRRERKLVRFDVNQTPRDLADSVLFGHVRGAFSGAIESRKGLVAEAEHGTLFLDEISDASTELQGKLKTLIEERNYRRVGEDQERHADIRIVVATNKDLAVLVEEGKFLSDLFFRLKVVEIELPPLRQRKEDIPILAEHFTREASIREFGYERTLKPDAIELLLEHDWPGNVRELKNLIQAALVYADPGSELCADDLRRPPTSVFRSTVVSTKKPLKEMEREFRKQQIVKAMIISEGNVDRAAETLGIDRTTLYRLLAEFELKHLIS